MVLVAGVVLLFAAGFAFLAWAFGGPTGLVGFVAPFVVLLGLVAVSSTLLLRRAGRAADEQDRRLGRDATHGGTGSKERPS